MDTNRSLTSNNERVLTCIETALDGILSEIGKRPYGNPVIALNRITSMGVTFDQSAGNFAWAVHSRQVIYGWPGKNKEEAWRFACVGRILAEIYTAIRNGVIITKREVYYQDPVLFRKQEVVDRYIDDIAHTFGVIRRDLNVTASPKGLYIGLMEGDRTVHTISDDIDVLKCAVTRQISWILVVEKEATFRGLAESNFYQSSTISAGIIVTGKGYPDLLTRQFLRAISNSASAPIPIYGIFDADPDGLEILRCYVVGSQTMAQEAAFSLPEMIWLGLDLEDVRLDDCIPLTTRDRKKAQSMLARQQWCEGCPGTAGYRDTLQHMLMLNMKAEIQALEDDSGLPEWLGRKMASFTSPRSV